MKSWKKLYLIGIVVIFVFVFISCDENGNKDPICECPTNTLRLFGEDCLLTCTAKGTIHCTCELDV